MFKKIKIKIQEQIQRLVPLQEFSASLTCAALMRQDVVDAVVSSAHTNDWIVHRESKHLENNKDCIRSPQSGVSNGIPTCV